MGGFVPNRLQLIDIQKNAIIDQVNQEMDKTVTYQYIEPTKYKESEQNICLKDEAELRAITIKDLQKDKIMKDTIIWGITIMHCCRLAAINYLI